MNMILISFLILLILALVLYYFFIQKIPIKIIAKAIDAKLAVQAQSGLFSFSSLVMETREFSLVVVDSKFRFSLLGLFSCKHKLLNISISKIHFKKNAFEKPASENPPKANIEPVFSAKKEIKQRIFSIIGFYIFRFCEINIKNLEIEDDKSNKIITSFKIHYERRDISALSIEIGDSSVSLNGKILVEVKKCSFSIVVELVAIFDFLSKAKSIIVSKWSISSLIIDIDQSNVTLQPGNFEVNFSPGNCTFSYSAITISIPLQLPTLTASLSHFSFDVLMPLREIEGIQMRQISANLEEFNVKIVSPHFLRLTDVSLTIGSFSKLDFNLSLSSFLFHYATPDGLQIFPLVKQLRDPVYKPKRIRFAFPDGHIAIKDFAVKLYLTDKARARLESSNVIYTDKAFQFSEVKGRINKHQMAVVKNFSISSPDETYFTFKADSVVAHDRHEVLIGVFILNILYGWRIIKPWASAQKYDSETLPFPIRIIVKKVCAKVHDNPINQKLATLVSVFPRFLQEKVVMKHIFDSKVNNLHFTSEQSKNASQRLSELYFSTYQEFYKKQTFHKYLVKLTVTDLDVSLDSRNVAPGMENLLHKFDPTTAELHPNVKWETLEGLKIDASVGTYECTMTTLKRPFMEGQNATLRGTVIIAEISDGRKIDAQTTIKNQVYMAPSNATDVKLYCDISINVDFFEWYFAGPAMKLMDDFADVISSFIPEPGIDPSPKLRWWDMLRSVLRGRFVGNVSHLVTNLVGGDDYNDQEDIMIVDVLDGRIQITEGNLIINTKQLDFIRARNGPIIIHLPNFSFDWSINWKTNGGNPRKHLVIPDIDRFGEPGYDTYNDFRANEYTFTFLINFTNDKLSPYVTVDIAHLWWILNPIMNLFAINRLNETYARKVGIPKPENRPMYYSFGSLPSTIYIKLNKTPMLSFRAFDHFPVKESSINGTSIDATFMNFNVNACFDMTRIGDPHIEYSINADSIMYHATDLGKLSRFREELSTTFMVHYNFDFKSTTEKMTLSIAKVRLVGNQFITKYIKEYFEAFFHFFPRFSLPEDSDSKQLPLQSRLRQSDNDLLTHLLRRRSSQKMVTAQRGKENRIMNQTSKSKFDVFNTPVLYLEVPKVEILLESLQYDASLMAIVDNLILNISKDEAVNCYCTQLIVDSLKFRQNVSFDTPGNSDANSELISFSTIKFMYYQSMVSVLTENHYEAFVSSINLNACSNDIALIKQFAQEIDASNIQQSIPEKDQSAQKDIDNPSFVDVNVEQFNALIYDSNNIPIGALVANNISLRNDKKDDNISESSILVQNFFIKDIRPDAINTVVCERWASQVEANMNSPIIRFQCKIPPPVGGIMVVNHLEINVDPTIVNYEATFFSVLIQFVLSKNVKCLPFSQVSFEFPKTNLNLPTVLLPPDCLPKMDVDSSKFMLANKSKEIKLITEKADQHFLLRYFKITSTKLNVSYHNPESKIPDINEFNGLFHEINYQDLTVTMETLIDKLVSDISSDMIPQFLKHMIGLGKMQESEETMVNQWLTRDHDKQPSKQKAMLFGNKKKTK
ncbi:hypothetical protein TRFO_23036 [Tritrichomonas foetus]|uniref:FMP27/BLTP2/Hobbit GFWDK motif-containing RBG unit domain-containing protein n=1 Tax=Tritrichomonas foetus TaxID=1144522 RepID=A0A1J4KBX9_9EUKA|nr:hypothetical protein TRFO_23036 [Tritrichomonas foetus]|eukprot:OHT08440.1 hypothetical protein TRFO_23036 [Tritrichomonas foetus]